MKVSNAFPSKYLAAADLNGKEPQVTIDRVEMASFDDGSSKPAVYFVGHQKGVVLNKTNATNIAMVHGDDTDYWKGKNVILFTAWVDFQGKSVQAIRVRGVPAPLNQPQEAPPAQTPPEGPDDLEDDIPW